MEWAEAFRSFWLAGVGRDGLQELQIMAEASSAMMWGQIKKIETKVEKRLAPSRNIKAGAWVEINHICTKVYICIDLQGAKPW